MITLDELNNHKETLLVYHGGGMDGCFWELNMGWFDKEGNYTSIYDSGYAGCKTKERMVQEFDDYTHEDFIPRAELQERFVPVYQEGFVQSVVRALIQKEWIEWDELTIECEMCGQKFTFEEITSSGYRGIGGIATENTGNICYECENLSNQMIYLYNDKGEYETEFSVAELWYDPLLKDVPQAVHENYSGRWNPPAVEGQEELPLNLPERTEPYLRAMSYNEYRDVDFEYNGVRIAQISLSEQYG